jgi:hypothetical protein
VQQLDRARGEALKREGMQAALDFAGEDWRELVVREFREWAKRQVALGMRTAKIEEFRAVARCHPPTTKAWGSLPRILIKEGLIRPVIGADGYPVRRPAAAARTHAHHVILYSLEVA